MAAGSEALKFKLVTVLFVPLYTRLKREDVLDHEVRGMIRGCVISDPGIHYNEILRRLGLSNGKAAYHIKTLEREGFIRSVTDGRYKRFYPPGMKVTDIPVRLNPTQKLILEIIGKNEGLSQRKIARLMDVSYPTVHRQVNKMDKIGVIRVVKKGTRTKCYVADDSLRQEWWEED